MRERDIYREIDRERDRDSVCERETERERERDRERQRERGTQHCLSAYLIYTISSILQAGWNRSLTESTRTGQPS